MIVNNIKQCLEKETKEPSGHGGEGQFMNRNISLSASQTSSRTTVTNFKFPRSSYIVEAPGFDPSPNPNVRSTLSRCQEP